MKPRTDSIRWPLLVALLCLRAGLLYAQAPAATPAPSAEKAGAPAEMAPLLAAHKAAIEGVAAEREKWNASLETWYFAGLDKLLNERKQLGDLDGVLAVKSERERVVAHQATTPEQMRAMSPALLTLRGTFEATFNKILGEVAKRTTAANQKYLADLEALQKRYTMSVKIDEAIQVKTERERFIASLTPSAPAPVASGGSAPSAPPTVPAPAAASGEGQELISALTTPHPELPIVLQGNDRITTAAKFKPPVEITVIAKTDALNLRLAYAADAIIFNWERDPRQFRIDGGPGAGKHKTGAGSVPKDTYVAIRWRVTPKKQSVSVDGQLRFEHEADYSKVDQPVSVFGRGSMVTVKSMKVLQLPAGTE